MDYDNSEKLESSKGRSDAEKEVYASLYLNALRRQLDEYHKGECEPFEDMEEEILEEIDEALEDTLEDIQPDLVIKRVKGLQFLIIDRDRYEKKLRDTDI